MGGGQLVKSSNCNSYSRCIIGKEMNLIQYVWYTDKYKCKGIVHQWFLKEYLQNHSSPDSGLIKTPIVLDVLFKKRSLLHA